MSSTPSSPTVRSRLAWALAVAAFAIAVAAGAEVKGRGARRPFEPPPDFGAGRWAVVEDAAEAVRVWTAAGLTGRKLVVLTGRWASLQSASTLPVGAPAGPQDFLTADNALFAAMRAGIARAMEVALPEPAYRQRFQEIQAAGGKGVVLGDGWFRHAYHGFERRFSRPGALQAQGEKVLVLVEPSFFAADAPPRPDALLQERGLTVDLGLVAAADPAASEAQQAVAAEFARAVGAVKVGVAP